MRQHELSEGIPIYVRDRRDAADVAPSAPARAAAPAAECRRAAADAAAADVDAEERRRGSSRGGGGDHGRRVLVGHSVAAAQGAVRDTALTRLAMPIGNFVFVPLALLAIEARARSSPSSNPASHVRTLAMVVRERSFVGSSAESRAWPLTSLHPSCAHLSPHSRRALATQRGEPARGGRRTAARAQRLRRGRAPGLAAQIGVTAAIFTTWFPASAALFSPVGELALGREGGGQEEPAAGWRGRSQLEPHLREAVLRRAAERGDVPPSVVEYARGI